VEFVIISVNPFMAYMENTINKNDINLFFYELLVKWISEYQITSYIYLHIFLTSYIYFLHLKVKIILVMLLDQRLKVSSKVCLCSKKEEGVVVCATNEF
jgi:hypothetical protein